MGGFVLDASVTLAWCFGDEQTANDLILLENTKIELAHVPLLWTLEISNALLTAERRKKITYSTITEFLAILNRLNIKIHQETDKHAFLKILPLAYAEGLTTYDATYLELAMQHGLPLATKDQQLKKAANRLGIMLI